MARKRPARGKAKPRAKTKRTTEKPVLIIQHGPYEHAAAVQRGLESQAILTKSLHPYRGDAYPRVSSIAGLISLGGRMGANDDAEHPWLARERKFLKSAVEAGMPVVGICLGGQLLARALGAEVGRHTAVEIGWFPIEVNEGGMQDPVVGAAGAAPTVYHWHGDTFQLPPGAQLLASSRGCERQAYRLSDRVYGFQFHPEADHELVLDWLDDSGVNRELRELQREHGIDHVQDAGTQREHAIRGERGSLKITAAITALFRREQYKPVPVPFRHAMEEWAIHRLTVVVEFRNAHGKIVSLRGAVQSTLTIAAGEYVIFQDDDTLLWPIRLDDIVRVGLA